jgi:hypothetical protein
MGTLRFAHPTNFLNTHSQIDMFDYNFSVEMLFGNSVYIIAFSIALVVSIVVANKFPLGKILFVLVKLIGSVEQLSKSLEKSLTRPVSERLSSLSEAKIISPKIADTVVSFIKATTDPISPETTEKILG